MDALLLVGFVLLFQVDWTGLPLHEWLGAGLLALVLVHLLPHWSWVKAVAARLFRPTAARPKLYFILDLLLLIGMLVIGVTGLWISTWLGLALEAYAAWRRVHIMSSVLTLLLLVVKLMLHWRWIVSGARSLFHRRTAPASGQPRVRQERREFLAVAGVATAAYVLAIAGVIRNDPRSRAAESEENVAESIAPDPAGESGPAAGIESVTTREAEASIEPAVTPATPETSPDSAGEPAGCVIRCARGCSYPGQCRRYVDANNNGRCDLGECL